MNISEGNAGAKTFHNASTLKAEDRRERLTFLGLSMPAVLAILIVVFLPIFWLSSLSFYNAAGELSTENYARIFESALYRRTFVVTFQISIAVTVICILLGYPLCYLLTKVKDRTAAILMIFVLVPFWTSVLVRTYAWLVLLQRNGIINSSLMSLGIIEEPLQLAQYGSNHSYEQSIHSSLSTLASKTNKVVCLLRHFLNMISYHMISYHMILLNVVFYALLIIFPSFSIDNAVLRYLYN